MRKEDTGVETFMSEDLLISLGAIRMALSWVEADGANGSEQARSIGIARLDDELAALQLRSREVARAIRFEARSQSPEHAPDAAHTAAMTGPDADKGTETPSWLTDLDAAPAQAEHRKPDPVPSAAPARPAPVIRRSGDLGHSIDELLISALSEQKDQSAVQKPAQI